jgi:hypothetical protein
MLTLSLITSLLAAQPAVAAPAPHKVAYVELARALN